MFVRTASHGSLALLLSATGLATLPSAVQAHLSFAPQNCASCHGNPTLSTSPGSGGFLKFGNNGNSLVGMVSSGQITITNATSNQIEGGFTGSFPGATGPFAPTTTQALAGSLGADGKNYLTPGQSDTRTYTYTPTGRTSNTTTLTFTPTNGFLAAPTVSFVLQGQGVAPVVSLDTTQVNAGSVRVGTTGSAQITVKNVGDGNLSGL